MYERIQSDTNKPFSIALSDYQRVSGFGTPKTCMKDSRPHRWGRGGGDLLKGSSSKKQPKKQRNIAAPPSKKKKGAGWGSCCKRPSVSILQRQPTPPFNKNLLLVWRRPPPLVWRGDSSTEGIWRTFSQFEQFEKVYLNFFSGPQNYFGRKAN